MSYETISGAPRAARRAVTPRFVVRRSRRAVALPSAIALRHGAAMPMPVSHAPAFEGLGFSLKPPKWVRKLQPGKILAKAAVPLAIAGALLIPGVGAAVVGAAGTVFKGAKAVVGGIGTAGSAVVDLTRNASVLPAADNVMPATVTQPAAPPGAQAQYQAAQVASSQGGMTYDVPAAAGFAPAGGINPAVVVGGLALAALLLAERK